MATADLYAALADALREDSTLSSVSYIGRDTPIKKATPMIGIRGYRASPIMGAYITYIKESFLVITAYSTSEVEAIKLADRVEELFHDADGGNTGYFDFSTDEIHVYSSRYSNRPQEAYSKDPNFWACPVIVSVIWRPAGC